MICSTCNTDVDEYYRGKQCKPCFNIPQRAYQRRNSDKINASQQKRRGKNPEKYRRLTKIWRKKNRVYWLIHHKLKDKYHARYLTDVYIRKRVRQSWGDVPHIITNQEILDRRNQIIRWRQKKETAPIKIEYKEPTLMFICPIVGREIPTETCHNMQLNYEYENCQECDHH